MERSRRYIALVCIFVLALLSLGIWGAVFAETPKGILTVAFLDVGQGDAIYIESPVGIEVIIDGGPDNSVLRELPKLMNFADRSIDAVIETHPDADHITGFVDLIERYKVGAYIEPGIIKDTAVAETLLARVDEKEIPHYTLGRGAWLDMGGGVMLRILSPDADALGWAQKDANEGSIIVQLLYASTSILFMGDATKKVEARLVELDGKNLESDILKAGHHGSRTSTGESFVAIVNPDITIISVGANNRYGLPTDEVLEILGAQNIKTLRTDEEGTIIFESNGKEFARIR